MHSFTVSRFCLAMKMAACVLALSTAANALTVTAAEPQYQDFDVITDTGVSLKNDQTLSISRPAGEVTVTAENYYITGSSDPNYPLTLNGEELESRGSYGSFGAYVALEEGENTFRFENGGQTQTVTITRGQPSGQVPTTKVLNRCTPIYDDLGYEGDSFTIRCTAPANAELVTAELNGERYTLKQEQIASTGVEAYYSTKITLPPVEEGEVTSLGVITYHLEYQGKASSKSSGGQVFVAGENASPLLRVSQNAATLYETEECDGGGTPISNHLSTLSPGAVDRIVDATSNMFQLSMGGWMKKDYVQVLEGHSSYQNMVSRAQYQENEEGGFLTISGTAASPCKSYETSEKVYLKFYNIDGMEDLSLAESDLFHSVEMTSDSDTVTLEFLKRSPDALIGYSVTYDDQGNITVFFNPKPQISGNSLEGVTVVLDAGHGGYDGGALGVLSLTGPYEKNITLATAIATQKRLEALGATVVMTVDQTLPDTQKVELDERNQIAIDARADFFISLHCNSIAENSNGLKPSGTEIYYYENGSKLLSDLMLENFTSYTGRDKRKVMQGAYYVTRTTVCPSMLIEMGFMTNPEEYDSMRNPQTIFQSANAVADTLLAYLKQ